VLHVQALGKYESNSKFPVEYLKGREHFGVLGVGGRII